MDTQEVNNSNELNNFIEKPIIITSSDNNNSIVMALEERIKLEEILKLSKRILEKL